MAIRIIYPLDDDSFVLFGDSCDPTDWFARQADTSSAHLEEIVKTITILISIYPTGQELPDQLPWNGADHWQAEVYGEEVADADWGQLRRQDHWWLHPKVLRPWSQVKCWNYSQPHMMH